MGRQSSDYKIAIGLFSIAFPDRFSGSIRNFPISDIEVDNIDCVELNRRMSSNKLLKIGKKFRFPDAPSGWLTWTVKRIMHFQDHRPQHRLLFPSQRRTILHETLPQIRNTCWMPPIDIDNNNNKVIRDGFSWYCQNAYRINDQFNKSVEEAGNQLLDDPWPYFRKGEAFDVVSFLSTPSGEENNGYLVRVDGCKVKVEVDSALRGKDVLVCCVLVPQFWESPVCDDIRGMITALSDVPDLEVVIVPQMIQPWAHDQDAFHHFLSAFPSSWLAIPFSDALRRDKVCKSLALGHFGCFAICLLVDDRHQTVVVERGNVDDIIQSCRPFCHSQLKVSWWETHTQLHSILDSEFVYKINNVIGTTSNPASVGIDHDENKVSVSVFDDKLVGLYLCCDGTLIRTLDLLSQECKARGQEFHIVLVYLPYKDSVDPALFQEAVNYVLHKLGVSSNPNWWVSPFNDYISRRLWEVQDYEMGTEEDQLVILDPKMNVVDTLGKYVINRLGVNGYPFTRHSIVRRQLEAIRAVTLESLLVYEWRRDYVLRNNVIDEVPIGELRGKNVLLYMDRVERPSRTYEKLLEWYNRNKTANNVADFEVVFVQSHEFRTSYFGNPKPMPMPMPWLVCPFHPKHTNFVKERLLNAGEDDEVSGMLAAFDKDGHIITLYGEDLLDSYGAEGFPSYNGLHNEVNYLVEKKYYLHMEDLVDYDAPVRGDEYDNDSDEHFRLFSS